jgi:hypothetical protein
MQAVGFVMVIFLALAGLAAAQGIFYKMNGRAFWRAMVPAEVRHYLYPRDPVRLDAFMIFEEWVALLFLGAYLLLPLIALHVMGFLRLFTYSLR